jgi:hypothetical protein
MRNKLEGDTEPVEKARYEVKYRLSPVPYSVRLFDLPSLFAGKLHALLFRMWKSRSKGRDFYDYLWYLSNKVPLNTACFEARLRYMGNWQEDRHITRTDLLSMLEERFNSVDYEQIKSDAAPFLSDTRSLEMWSKEFFMVVSQDNLLIEQA